MKKQTNPNIKAHLLRSALYPILLVVVCVIPFTLAQRTATRTLTFADRVAYQRAIEDVYWRHRIWPKENPGAKPSLDEVMPIAQIEKKVEEYLRNSQALEAYGHQPIGPEQLQAEMDRMAHDTKQPEVLREIFDALGNDPAVIAECLARPVLAERSVRDLPAQGKLDAGQAQSAISSSPTMAAIVPMTYTLPVVTSAPTTCFDNWTATADPGPEAPGRAGHTAVWTGSEMIIWGGGNSGTLYGGARYNPTTDSWSLASETNEPVFRSGHTAVWTGTEMIVWGGQLPSDEYTNSGGRYNPATDSWTATTIVNAPDGRDLHTAVWTGTEMIVWGGETSLTQWDNSGGRYNPSTDSWTATSFPWVPCGQELCPLEGRYQHTAVWTGTEMIVWGGGNGTSINGLLFTGGRYNPSTDGWAGTSTINVPSARYRHTAVWTGSEMIIWAGNEAGDFTNTGGKYNPTTDSWTPTTTTNAPTARLYHTAVWTGGEMIAWGGGTAGSLLDTGGRYNPITDSWLDTSTTNAPEARSNHTAVWTGSEMIVWGGYGYFGALATGGRYCGQASPTPTPTPTPTPPVRVTVKTNPAGLSFTVDGTTYTAAHRFSWVAGSSHTIATTSLQSGGTGVQYAWTKWSDHGAISHTVAPSTNTTYTATFKTQYFLTMAHGTGGRVTPSSAWKNSGAVISISATPNSGFSFSNWTGSGTGSYSGPNNPASITMGGPITETATFTHN